MSEKKIDDIYSDLIVRALEDGVITDDEKGILQKVKMEGNAYDAYLKKALEDGIIDDKEKKNLTYLRSNLLENTFLEADKDNKITEDELTLMNHLVKLLKEQGEVTF